ncbi:MAG: NRDE family protein [Deltaproteobacteria bacterium]|nr:NRDE family protein [Deltaproteobacteria bacterium]
MCLILFSYQTHPAYPLILAANRDEFYNRPTSALAYWSDHPEVLAGRDLKGNGTWLGVSRSGRFAAITNYRDPTALIPDAPSRGILIQDYLVGNSSAQEYLDAVSKIGQRYNGFNLIAGDMGGLYYTSNRSAGVQQLRPGIYGISNRLIDTAWPKVQRGKALLHNQFKGRQNVNVEKILGILADRSQPADAELPETGVGLEWERMLAPMFIISPDYGTRSSSVILFDQSGEITFWERTFVKTDNGIKTGETRQYKLK